MPTAREVVEAIFSGFIRMQRGGSRGCMIVSGALACGEDAEPVRQALERKGGHSVERKGDGGE
jgi:hypothetical protein